MLVYSVTDNESFEALNYWVNEIENNAEQNHIKFLVGTKTDIIDFEESEGVATHTAQEFARQINAHFFQTSAKENLGISKMFKTAMELCA